MDISGSIQVCCYSVHGSMGCNQESFAGVWRWHQLLSGSLPHNCLSQVSHQLWVRPRNFHLARILPAHGSMGCDKKNFIILIVWRWHQLLSGSLPNGRLSRVSRTLGQKLFRPPLYVLGFLSFKILKAFLLLIFCPSWFCTIIYYLFPHKIVTLTLADSPPDLLKPLNIENCTHSIENLKLKWRKQLYF